MNLPVSKYKHDHHNLPEAIISMANRIMKQHFKELQSCIHPIKKTRIKQLCSFSNNFHMKTII